MGIQRTKRGGAPSTFSTLGLSFYIWKMSTRSQQSCGSMFSTYMLAFPFPLKEPGAVPHKTTWQVLRNPTHTPVTALKHHLGQKWWD